MDSKLGWAKGYRELIAMLYAGHIPKYDLSKLRPEGSILKTFGGRASGPNHFEDYLNLQLIYLKMLKVEN
jgi:ribonucleoside-diphosphate reductase alpha chain